MISSNSKWRLLRGLFALVAGIGVFTFLIACYTNGTFVLFNSSDRVVFFLLFVIVEICLFLLFGRRWR